MKGMIYLLMACTISLTACTGNVSTESENINSNSQNVMETEANNDNTGISDEDLNNNINNSGQNIEKEVADMKINIVIGNETFTATLENNNTAMEFADKLPLTLDMSDLNGNEKYSALSSAIRKERSYSPGTINAGDIMCYSDNYIVLFYKTFKTSYSYVPVGHVDDVDGYVKALGKGDLKVTFSPAEK